MPGQRYILIDSNLWWNELLIPSPKTTSLQSKKGPMKTLQMLIKDGRVNACWNFRNKSIVFLALVKNDLIGTLRENFESKCSFRGFWESAFLTEILLKKMLE